MPAVDWPSLVGVMGTGLWVESGKNENPVLGAARVGLLVEHRCGQARCVAFVEAEKARAAWQLLVHRDANGGDLGLDGARRIWL